MKKLYKLFVLLFIIGSCTVKKDAKMETGALIIKDEIILNNLQEYYDKFLSDVQFEYMLTLDIAQDKDTNTFVISYDMNLFALTYNPPLMYIKVNKMVVAIKSSLGQYLSQTEEYKLKQLEENLPTQFKAYKEQDEIPPPTTFRNEVWVLKFKGDKFISKETKTE